MNEWQMEVFENYDDSLDNAQLFRIYREIFNSKDDSRNFSNICKGISDDVLKILDCKYERELEKFSKYASLTEKDKKTFQVKIQNAKLFLEKRENRYKFNDWLKQIVINLFYADETFRWIRYSRNSNFFKEGEYYYKFLVHFNAGNKPKDVKLYYYTFLFIIDSLNILGIIEHKIDFFGNRDL